MERVRSQKFLWKKIGAGSFRMANLKYIKPGQIFEATEEEIPVAFRDLIVRVDGDASPSPVEVEKKLDDVAKEASEYTLKARGGGGWYDVVDINGKVVNEKALKQDAALELINTLK